MLRFLTYKLSGQRLLHQRLSGHGMFRQKFNQRFVHIYVRNWEHSTPQMVTAIPFSSEPVFQLTLEQSSEYLNKLERAHNAFHRENTTKYEFSCVDDTNLTDDDALLFELSKILKEHIKANE